MDTADASNLFSLASRGGYLSLQEHFLFYTLSRGLCQHSRFDSYGIKDDVTLLQIATVSTQQGHGRVRPHIHFPNTNMATATYPGLDDVIIYLHLSVSLSQWGSCLLSWGLDCSYFLQFWRSRWICSDAGCVRRRVKCQQRPSKVQRWMEKGNLGK